MDKFLFQTERKYPLEMSAAALPLALCLHFSQEEEVLTPFQKQSFFSKFLLNFNLYFIVQKYVT